MTKTPKTQTPDITELDVTVYGPNLRNTPHAFHVHAADCKHAAQYARGGTHEGDTAGGLTFTASDIADVVVEIYPPADFDYDPRDPDEIDSYATDFYIAPCAKALVRNTDTILGAPGETHTTAPTHCECGCGAHAAPKRRFLPGHDAKLKSSLLARYRSGDLAEAGAATALAAVYGWQRFLTPAPTRTRKTTTKPTPAPRLLKVGRWTYPVVKVVAEQADGTVRAIIAHKDGDRETVGKWVA